jgi:hypothetical protein
MSGAMGMGRALSNDIGLSVPPTKPDAPAMDDSDREKNAPAIKKPQSLSLKQV